MGANLVLLALDFSKVFDAINHLTQLSILKSCGSLLYFCVFLYLDIGNHVSSHQHLWSDVPQGSILRPLLFVVYTSQIVKFLEYCSIHLNADNTQLSIIC